MLLVLLVGIEIGCTRQQSKSAAINNETAHIPPDLTAVYRADRELQAALSSPSAKRLKYSNGELGPASVVSEIERLQVKLKTEASILQDQVSADPALKDFVPLANKYSQIVRVYQAEEETRRLRHEHILCILAVEAPEPERSASLRACDQHYGPQEQAQARIKTAIGQISTLEAEATRMYLELTRPKESGKQ